jgi:hypothetical protein
MMKITLASTVAALALAAAGAISAQEAIDDNCVDGLLADGTVCVAMDADAAEDLSDHDEDHDDEDDDDEDDDADDYDDDDEDDIEAEVETEVDATVNN